MNESEPDIQPGRRAGRFMLLLAWLLALAILTMVFGDWEEQQVNPNREPVSSVTGDGMIQVILQRNRQGHYVASGFINEEPVIFLLDTGATDVVLPARVAERAGLQRGPESRARTAAGVIRVWQTRIPTLRLGEITFHDLPATINPHMDGDDVLLGMSALRQVEFQQSGKELRIRHQP